VSAQSDFDKLLRQLAAYGWSVSQTERGHWRLRAPTGQTVIASGTPSDHRANKNLLAQLKRAGYVPRRGRPPKAKPVPSEVPAAPVAPAAPEPELPPVNHVFDRDIVALDHALSALADVEQIIKRYRTELTQLAELKRRLT